MENKISDNQLMYDFAQCSLDAYKQIFNRNKNKLLNFIMRAYLKDRMIAEDIVAKSLIKVYEYKHKYKPSNEFSTWVFTIARNLALNEIKRNKPISYDQSDDQIVLESYSSSNPIQIVENEDISKIVLETIQSLKPKYAEVITLRYLQGLAFKEISEILKMNNYTVKSIARRGLDQLNEKLLKLKFND